jgi:hypothetical protein
MGVGSRPATCASCNKRLNRRSWYYRNGHYFCKKSCWVTGREKLETTRAELKAHGTAAAAAPAAQATQGAASVTQAGQAAPAPVETSEQHQRGTGAAQGPKAAPPKDAAQPGTSTTSPSSAQGSPRASSSNP